jgi:uncharacterized membrane protein YkvA (DUF1232 family)
MDEFKNEYTKEYSESNFWTKVKKFSKNAGKEVVEKALQLYYAAQRPEIPAWAKSVIYGALGYFIFPADAIPDVVPAVGYADDLGVLAAAIATVSFYINDEIKDRTRRKTKDWF